MLTHGNGGFLTDEVGLWACRINFESGGHLVAVEYGSDATAAALRERCAQRLSSKVLCSGWPTSAARATGVRARAWRVADHLAASGAVVEFCNPHIAGINAEAARFPLTDFTADSLSAADVVVVLVDHAEFDPEVIAVNSALVFDAKNIMRDTEFTGDTL